jgi:hypothetical protein
MVSAISTQVAHHCRSEQPILTFHTFSGGDISQAHPPCPVVLLRGNAKGFGELFVQARVDTFRTTSRRWLRAKTRRAGPLLRLRLGIKGARLGGRVRRRYFFGRGHEGRRGQIYGREIAKRGYWARWLTQLDWMKDCVATEWSTIECAVELVYPSTRFNE